MLCLITKVALNTPSFRHAYTKSVSPVRPLSRDTTICTKSFTSLQLTHLTSDDGHRSWWHIHQFLFSSRHGLTLAFHVKAMVRHKIPTHEYYPVGTISKIHILTVFPLLGRSLTKFVVGRPFLSHKCVKQVYFYSLWRKKVQVGRKMYFTTAYPHLIKRHHTCHWTGDGVKNHKVGRKTAVYDKRRVFND